MQYHSYEMNHALLAPLRAQAGALRRVLDLPFNPVGGLPWARAAAAACEVFEGLTKRYGKPGWGIESTKIFGLEVPVREEVVHATAFCDLLHFDRDERVCGKRYDPKVLLIAPLSGHYATLLRGTVQAMIQEHNLYITDWRDARDVPLAFGRFDLDDYIEHVIECIRFVGSDTHVVAVCQPAVPALAAAALMAARGDPFRPASLTLMGGPIDTRRNPTVVNQHAKERPIAWFERNVIDRVPWPNAGFLRRVYPGFIQLTGFMQMNLERHVEAHLKLFDHLVKGDCDSAQAHRTFYDEYLAVMDLPAEFYLQTVRTVFQEHALPDGRMMHRGEPVDCRAIEDIALMTVEGEKDDICGVGQTEESRL
jgi:poly(3-hydroxybutyrate) depolymerase